MKRFLLQRVFRIRLFTTLIVTLCAFVSMHAEESATSDEINAAIVNSPVPMSWVNDSNNPWTLFNGSLHKSVESGESSSISTSFTIDKYSLFETVFSYDSYNGYNIGVYIDGVRDVLYGSTNSISVVLEPGTHTITFELYNNASCSCYLYSVTINQQWDEVIVNYPGDLEQKIKDLKNNIGLRELKLLKVTGTLGLDDWKAFQNIMVSSYDNLPLSCYIAGIDISNTDITTIPVGCFSDSYNDFRNLSTVIFPETLKSISSDAFKECHNIFHIHIPSSVERIEDSSFDSSYIKSITFGEDSRLKTIGYRAFYYTDLQDLKIPDSVLSIEAYAFSKCRYLSNIKMSNTLEEISYYAFENSGLDEVVIPKKCKIIGQGAFAHCRDLKKVTLNSYADNLYDTFANCVALDTLIIASATPPSIISSSDPFNNVRKDSVKLLVPDFVVDLYKNDTYWTQFADVEAYKDILERDYWAIHGYVMQSENQKFSGTPSIEMETGGVLDILENTALALDEVIFNNVDIEPPCFYSKSSIVTIKNLTTKFVVPLGGKWYFFSPGADVKMSDVTFTPKVSWLIRYYDGGRRASENSSSGNWINMPSNGVLKCGQGYLIQASTPGILSMPSVESDLNVFSGVEDAMMTLSDNACESLENMGWNLVANPYPTFYDVSQMKYDAPITVWTGSTYRAFSILDDDFVLRPLQPFFVQKYASDLSFGMPKEGRLSGYEITRSSVKYAKGIDINRDCINIEIAQYDSDETDDYTRVVINEAASNAYEGNRDAPKFMSSDTNVAQIYSLGENHIPMAINERPYDTGEASLGMYIPKSGDIYRISAKRADRNVWLYDSVEDMECDLAESDYIFTSAKAGVDNSRFTLRFAPATGTFVEDVYPFEVKVLGGNGMLTVCAPSGSDVLVVSVDGNVITNERVENSSLEITAPAGLYVVKVNGKGYKSIVK